MARPRSRSASPALLVGNPAAQSGRNAQRIAQARTLLDRAGLAHDFLATLPHGETAGLVRRALEAGPCSMAIAMGGDGTLAEVARGLVASGLTKKIPLGLLPTGTANDIGTSFGLGSGEGDLARNVRVLREGATTGLDAGMLSPLGPRGTEAKQELFIDSVGWGFGPRVLRTRNEERKSVEDIPLVRDLYRDHLVYAASAFRAMGESYLEDEKFDVEGVADGVPFKWKDLNDLVVKGPRIYAGLWVLDPKARHDDGKFEVVPFAGRRDWLSKALLCLDHSGGLAQDLRELGLSHSQGLSASRIELHLFPHRGGHPLPAQVDGEEFPVAPAVRIEVLPRALQLVVPADRR